MAEHNAPITHIAFQRADGTTGVLDIHDESSMHDAPDVVKAENITDGAVGNGKIAPKSVTEAELADGSVTTAVIADGAVTIGKLSPEMQESWDSISQNQESISKELDTRVRTIDASNAQKVTQIWLDDPNGAAPKLMIQSFSGTMYRVSLTR